MENTNGINDPHLRLVEKRMAETEEKSLASEISSSDDLEDRIRARAYELYEQRGKEDGHALEDWLRAEAELTSGKHAAAAA